MAFNCVSAPLAINRIDNLHLQLVIKASTCGSSNKIGIAEGKQAGIKVRLKSSYLFYAWGL
ncbi:hypothetical protein PanWU01x14_339690 [Parasponia andersonii]|uniref:Uncharacterized protein n=1 Tax=Parasponia andersonii TaxID=3476 RepID=A0A2P5AEM6_PARAD|nr:hypothetical protein PanWU01x14_339690 [Parasponia andersonii]